MKPLFPIAILFVALLSGCVTKKEYQEMEELKTFYEQEAQSTDSLQNEYNKLAEETRQLEIEVRNTRLELEEYVVTNKSLNRSYQDLLQRMDRILEERNELTRQPPMRRWPCSGSSPNSNKTWTRTENASKGWNTSFTKKPTASTPWSTTIPR